ncbi:MAG: hypothetical protein HFF50_02965 [Lawsonibacter sp.]|nr:hypothetical protein [Lawsonibacter sp.]
MGIFDFFKKQSPDPAVPPAPAAERKPFGPNVVEIAKLISAGDEAVMADIAACTGDPAAWFEAHQARYKERCVLSADDLEKIQWLGMVDILEEHGWVCERDWKDELEDFSYFVQNLHGSQKLGLEMNPDWFDENEDIPLWCNILTEKWSAQGVRLAAININSDSYVLFPASAEQYSALQTLAKSIGQYIDYVERE